MFEWALKLTDVGSVIGGAKDEFRGAVVTRANVADVGFAGHEDLGRAEVAQLQDARGWVQEQILRLDVAVADAYRVDVGERAEKLDMSTCAMVAPLCKSAQLILP